MCNKMDPRYLSKMIGLFSCTNCGQKLRTPIRECSSKHSFCDDCFRRSVTCSACGNPCTASRNDILEDLCNVIYARCRYSPVGCEKEGFRPAVEEHEDDCIFGMRSCPMQRSFQCHWYGPTHRMLDHCREEHGDNVVESAERRYRYRTCFDDAETDDEFEVLICAYGELFLACWRYEPRRCFQHWSAYHLGNPGSCQYSFEVELYDRFDAMTPQRAYRAPCMSENDVSSRDCTIIVHRYILRQYCRDGNMEFLLSIIKEDM